MTVLVTGATGFVMSVLAREWLEAEPDLRLIALDAAPLDEAARRYFAPVADRMDVIVADVTRPETWAPRLEGAGITHVVHGATVTPLARGTAGDIGREPEANDPGRIIAINVMGTVALLDWARMQPGIRRVVYVSSGAVYRHHGPDRPGEALPEDGYVMPRRLYGISKWTSEMIAERYGELFGLSTISVRFSSVYGTMDRATASRNFRHVPNRIAHKALDLTGPLLVNTLDAVGDYIHAEDVAAAIRALCRAPSLTHGVYNIAAGETTTIGHLVDWAAEKCPGFSAKIVPAAEAEMIEDASLTGGMWGAYDIARITAETDWRPRPPRDAFHAYMDWIAAQRAG
ncbi:NAD(P)-dependent oxidoreductase [Acidisoma cellulosilytica]|uniref:NAD(P)-dependent oxidoreductase n=1 Tax=Acidisoma cellulosilyticum TaxID=2802395 RepID=A0A964E643_9PROT|nr:NAD(P)-dependent oxidoreductase [Acidisoma cellulosilyticum]MCB8883112.1 NAD(P)-dependent oxidoreductase [Acidisoma cellulosilyticum]